MNNDEDFLKTQFLKRMRYRETSNQRCENCKHYVLNRDIPDTPDSRMICALPRVVYLDVKSTGVCDYWELKY